MNLAALLLASLVVGVALGVMLALRMAPHPLGQREIDRRGLTRCIMCQGAGCYRDLGSQLEALDSDEPQRKES